MIATDAVTARDARALWPWSVFAGLLAMAGLPIYIHAPTFFADSYGVSLATLGLVLGALRFIDVVQDPLLGWLAQRIDRQRPVWAGVATAAMAASLYALFALPPLLPPVWWFAVTLTCLFTAFSFLTILFYAEGVARAAELGSEGHIRLAGWREGGALVGVSVAAVLPSLLAVVTDTPMAGFAIIFAGLAVTAVLAMRGEWSTVRRPAAPGLWSMFGPALSDRLARRLLVLAVVNAAPVAVTSTLFLIFVEDRLSAPAAAGPLLLLFFLAAAASTPLWSRLAQRFGARSVLAAGMTLSIAAFLWAARLDAGDVTAFAVICVLTGATLGADMTLLPALFARRLAEVARGSEAASFALWSFASKLALALAAVTVLPALAAGPDGTAPPDPERLSALYALLPCALKIGALALILTLPAGDGHGPHPGDAR